MSTHEPLAAPPPAAPIQPVAASERIVALDVLRGIALLGVLVANVWLWFSGIWFLFPEYQAHLRQLSLDSAVFAGIGVVVSGKAITTFSFLFGIGFALQMIRARERGTTSTRVQLRRLGVLLVIGVLHGFLLWYGDILMAYALMGFALLLFRNRRDRTLLVWAAVLVVGVPLVMAAIPLAVSLAGASMPDATAELAAMAELRERALAAFRASDPAAVLAANREMLAFFYVGPKSLGMLYILGVFLLGLYVGRRRILENPGAHGATLRRVAVWGMGVGLPLNVALMAAGLVVTEQEAMALPWYPLLSTVLGGIGIPLLAAGYVAATCLLLQRDAWRRRLTAFAPVGRMALTNYLAQTVASIAIFYGLGFGLIGSVGPAAALVISLAVFGMQMAWSAWWLARYRFGPMEWLWRTLTYGRLQPMRIRDPAGAAVPG
jgi:uncharacterized protein